MFDISTTHTLAYAAVATAGYAICELWAIRDIRAWRATSHGHIDEVVSGQETRGVLPAAWNEPDALKTLAEDKVEEAREAWTFGPISRYVKERYIADMRMQKEKF